MHALIHLVFAFFRVGITTVKGAPDPVGGTEQAGALVPNSALVQQLAAFQANASPTFGNFSGTIIPAISASTYPAPSMVGGFIRRFSPGAAFTDSTDTATNIIAAIPGAKVNQSFPMVIANLGSGLLTLASNTGVQLAGTTQVGSSQARLYLGVVTGSNTITLTGQFAWNLGTGGTNVSGL